MTRSGEEYVGAGEAGVRLGRRSGKHKDATTALLGLQWVAVLNQIMGRQGVVSPPNIPRRAKKRL